MKASQVLEQYAAGKRNFQRLNLRGQSFKGQNLSGADFSEADLRSTNFSGANLTEANFTKAKCGLQKRWIILLNVTLLLLLGISAVASFLFANLIQQMSLSGLDGWIVAILVPMAVIIFFYHTLFKSAGDFSASAGFTLGLLAGTGLLIVIITTPIFHLDLREAFINYLLYPFGSFVSAFAIAGGMVIACSGIFAISRNLGRFIISCFVVAEIVAINISTTNFLPQLLSLIFVLGFTLYGCYLGNLAMTEEKENRAWITDIVLAFAAQKSTSFYGVDLTDAKFQEAVLKNTNLRKSNLTRVRWYQAQMLDMVRPRKTYLKSTRIRKLVTGKNEDNKNFDEKDLRGINLEGVDLRDASFINANLSEANLRYADLSRAKLVQTKLDGTNFTGATLTGACIEDWGITSHTKLDGVRCKYVFMRLPTDNDPEPCRKPDNRSEVFEDADFADFIKPIRDTLDLYHNQGVDPRAIAISWKELAENNPDAKLQFASMEVKGENNLLLRFKTDPNADKSKLNQEYFQEYNKIKALNEAQKLLLIEKDDRIKSLEIMLHTGLKRPYFNVEKVEGELFMAGEKRDIKIDRGNYNEKIEGNYYEQSGNFGIGHMSGGKIKDNARVTGVINEAEKQNLADAAREIQQLLEQMSETYPTTTSKEKNIVVGEAVDRIESNPKLKAKVINALKTGGTEAFKEAVNHPLVNILVATIEGWQDAE